MAKTVAVKRAHRKFSEVVAGSGTERYRESRDWTETGDGTDYPTDVYRVVRLVNHDNETYLPGDAIELTAEQAAPLLVVKHIDKPEFVNLVVRTQSNVQANIPTVPMPERVVAGVTSEPRVPANGEQVITA